MHSVYESHSTGTLKPCASFAMVSGGPGAASAFKIGQIALAYTCLETQIQLRLIAPVTDGLQPTLTSEDCCAYFRRQHVATSSFPGMLDSDVVGGFAFGVRRHYQPLSAGRLNDM